MACFNARSVGSKFRRTEIGDFLTDNDIDILLLTEAWHKENGDEGKLADLTPAGYSIKSFPRRSRGGGIAIVTKDIIFCRMTFSTDFI